MVRNKAIKGSWPLISGRLKTRYKELKSVDLAYEDGKEQKLFQAIEMKIGKTHDELITEINTILLND